MREVVGVISYIQTITNPGNSAMWSLSLFAKVGKKRKDCDIEKEGLIPGEGFEECPYNRLQRKISGESFRQSEHEETLVKA